MPKKKIKLSDPQYAFLTLLVKEPTTAVENYGPARKLVELGFATRSEEGRYGAVTFSITEEGRAHFQAIHMEDRKCHNCKTAPWTCRKCGRKACEHHCVGKKPDGTATCGRCTR